MDVFAVVSIISLVFSIIVTCYALEPFSMLMNATWPYQ